MRGGFGVPFNATGKHKYSAYCPFHKDTNDSLKEDVKLFYTSSSPERRTPAPAIENIVDDEPLVTFSEPVALDKEVGDALERSASFYHGFLADAVDTKFHKISY